MMMMMLMMITVIATVIVARTIIIFWPCCIEKPTALLSFWNREREEKINKCIDSKIY
jgi:hypothetical protein